jgi:hypothetical protein
MDPELTQLSLQLANTAVRNSASAVAERINSARTRKRDQETIAELEEIVNELVADKAELVRIAQAYEEEFVAQRLSPENVEYIIGSIVPVLERLVADSGDEAAVQKVMASGSAQISSCSLTEVLSQLVHGANRIAAAQATVLRRLEAETLQE